MNTSRDDVSISIRSALLQKGTQRKFSLTALVLISITLIFIETIETKPLNFARSFIKDVIYRSSVVISSPSKGFKNFSTFVKNHFSVYNNYYIVKKTDNFIKSNIIS